jgi:hypothetical protein
MSSSGFVAKRPTRLLPLVAHAITLPTLDGYAHLLLCCFYEAAPLVATQLPPRPRSQPRPVSQSLRRGRGSRGPALQAI